MLGRDAKLLSHSLQLSGHKQAVSVPHQAADPTCVPDDVVEHHQPLKLQQQLPVGVLWERLSFKASQPVVSILVAFHEELEGAHLKQGKAALQGAGEDGEVATGRRGGQQPYLGRQTNAVEALANFRHLLQGQPLSSGLHPVDGTVVKGFTGQIHHLGGQGHRCQQEHLATVTRLADKTKTLHFPQLCPA